MLSKNKPVKKAGFSETATEEYKAKACGMVFID
jgi:hypothetical protein